MAEGKTMAQLIEELRQYPADARVLSAKLTIVTPTLSSKFDWSERRARMMAEMRRARGEQS